jgi:hypothetical protein
VAARLGSSSPFNNPLQAWCLPVRLPRARPLGAIVGRPLFANSSASEAARFISWRFRVSRGGTCRLVRVVGHALFWRLRYRAGGCHRAHEGITHRSTQWHCIVPFLLSIPLPGATNLASYANNIRWAWNADRSPPGLSPTIRAREAGSLRLDKLILRCQPLRDLPL